MGQQLPPTEDSSRMLDEVGHESEFGWRQIQGVTLDSDPVGYAIERDGTDLQHVATVGGWWTSQGCIDPGDELVRTGGLEEVVVDAIVESPGHIARFSVLGSHQNPGGRTLRYRAKRGSEIKRRAVCKQPLGNDGVDSPITGQRQGAGRIAGPHDVMAGVTQGAADTETILWIRVDDENSGQRCVSPDLLLGILSKVSLQERYVFVAAG